MFATVDDVRSLTGYVVTVDMVVMAQGIIETFVGKVEAEVSDPNDMQLLNRSVAYQAAYMTGNTKMTFEQISVKSLSVNGQTATYSSEDSASPWIAPLAVIACKKLSWTRPRSVKTGAMYGPACDSTWSTE